MSLEILNLIKKEMNKNESIEDKDLKIIRFQFFRKSNILKIILKGSTPITADEEIYIEECIKKVLDIKNKIEIIFYQDISNISLEAIINEQWNLVVNDIAKKIPLAKAVLINGKRSILNNSILIKSGYEKLHDYIRMKKIPIEIEKNIENIFGIKTKINFEYDSSLEVINSYDDKLKEEKEALKNIFSGNNEVKAYSEDVKSKDNKEDKSNQKKSYYDKREAKSENSIIGRNITEDTIPIREINETSGIVSILGEVFKTEIVETKTGKIILTFFITDYTSSIMVKCFLRPQDTEYALDNIKKGLYCKVRGEAQYDTYAREVLVMGRDVLKMSKIERMDMSDEKRVELHCHTTMSAMDGIVAPAKIIERAARFGHKAIGITDHGVVQAFPDSQNASKKHKIKVLYGVEAYLVNDGIPIAINETGQSFDDEYVVFDLETTGFSSKNDKIIEIGAVKIKNRKIIDRFSEFVYPKCKIPYKITELTGITDEMVMDAESIETVLPRFMDFIKDTVVVAHNATFDTAFIKKNCDDLNLEFDNTVMDTVPLARFLYPELKRVKLNLVAKYLGISLENHHRAVDDAKATAEIFIISVNKIIEEMGINNLKDFNHEYLSKMDIKKENTYHIIIYAKTQEGLKNLYKLISEAHIDNFHKHPRTKKSRLMEMREGLILGSACSDGEIYRAVLDGKSDEEIKEKMGYYDYIEIQPIVNNIYLINKGNVKDEEELRSINKRLYKLATQVNKPVVATGDVHFLDPQDEIFRKIIMAGQGFSRNSNNQPPLYFKTTDEMIKEFSYLGKEIAREVVITNTNMIADSIDVIKPIPDETYAPKIEGADDEIREMTMNKVHSIYGYPLPEVVQKRLDKELNSIINNGYAVLYLIAQKLVAKSLEDGYLVGSRGSVGSSFVATMSNITEVNGLPPHYVCPSCKKSEFFLDGSISSGADLEDKNCPICGTVYIKDGHDIPFETFLGFEGDKEPDIDLNFSGDNQAEIHKYTEVLFGKGFVFKAGTIGTIAEKTAYGYVRKYLDEKNIIVPNAEIERLTLGCTGIKRTTGQHPGGIMVVPNDNEIYNFTPIQRPADDVTSDVTTTHFDYHSISGRLLKLDILGHDDPTMIRMLQDLTGVDPKSIPLNDKKVISLFTSPEALGITKEELGCEVGSYGLPEFGTKFVRGMLVDTQPKSFADLVRISGLSHGTDVWLNNAQYYIKEGYTTLKDCISTRDDIMVYLMYAGVPPKMAFTIMESVRKGKGLTEDFEKTMIDNNVPEWYIESCKKIKYMFPKGHAVAYVMMAVRIAYYKVYYPEAYYVTFFTVRADDFDADLICKGPAAINNKLSELYALGNKVTAKDKGLITSLELAYELYARNFKFKKVDLYISEANKFTIEEDGIRPPLSSLEGVGENAANNIVEARKNGEFISKEDIRTRSKVSKTVIEALDNHGCLIGMSETNQLSLF